MVQLRADPTRQGAVIEVLGGKSDSVRYRVFHSATSMAEYYGEQLVPTGAGGGQDEWLDAMTQDQGLSASTFRARLTAARLAHPLNDTLYALMSSRIQFIPFQFRPLLKLLKSDKPRLLIADEVGVGKTIESGLILRELQARQELKNVLVVCPKALVYKWKAELRRFEETFKILDSSSLAYCLKETYAEGEWPSEYGRAILPLELLRREENLVGRTGGRGSPKKMRGLTQLTPPPAFDLLIVDEAHHVKNPGTLSYEAARFLCDVSVAAIFLSATPVHLGSENLYHLLNLLRPDLFLSRDVFEEMVEPTKFLHQASRIARQAGPDWQVAAMSELDSATRTRWGSNVLSPHPVVGSWLDKLGQPSRLSNQERVSFLRELDELQPFSGIINRTRRRDIGKFTIRDPHTVQIEFTPSQLAFYEGVLEFRRRWLAEEHDPLVVRLITDTLERQAASCLPALAARFDRFLQSGRISGADLTDYDDERALVDASFPSFLFEDARRLATLAAEVAAGEDPKFQQLEIVVANAIKTEEGSGKILIFSFFLHTLEYLLRGLSAQGYRVALINGSTPELDREALRDRFSKARDDAEAIDVLLSSEVGCEGLDYQFCDRLVNYDIPWNPMRIEQRIGRIDRFGQKSDKVLIFNFVTPGTVEERIFFRCFERLGVFQETLGDLEGVLGEATVDLSRLSLDLTLSPDEVERQTKQIADNYLRQAEEVQRLEQDSEALLGSGLRVDRDDVDVREDGKFLAPKDLREMVESYLIEAKIGCELVERTPHLYRLRSRRGLDLQALLQGLSELERSEAVIRFQRFLQLPDHERTLTFDQDIASQMRSVEFVTPLHPLARAAVTHWSSSKAPLVSHLQVDGLTEFPKGSFVFLIELWEQVGVRTELSMVHTFWNLETQEEEIWPAAKLAALFGVAHKSTVKLEQEKLVQGLEELQEALADRRRQALRELQRRNAFLSERQVASLESYYRSRLSNIDNDLSIVTEERVRRMKASERQRLEGEQKQRRDELLNRREADILTQRIAAGTLRVC